MFQLLVSIALTSSVFAAGIPNIEQDPPVFCNKLDCPKFDTVQTFKEVSNSLNIFHIFVRIP